LAAAVNVTDMDADVVVNNAKPFEDVPPDTLPAVITIDIRDDGTPNDAAMIYADMSLMQPIMLLLLLMQH
jgi:hypothetical protein